MAQRAASLVVVSRKWLQQADFHMISGFAEQFPLDAI
jgi:hypothetical protein